jgi:hypothetical protein
MLVGLNRRDQFNPAEGDSYLITLSARYSIDCGIVSPISRLTLCKRQGYERARLRQGMLKAA